MKCPVCNGTGVHYTPHIPSETGGWLNDKYSLAAECGACSGSGSVEDYNSNAFDDSDSRTTEDDVERGSELSQLIDLRYKTLSTLEDSALPSELKYRWSAALKAIDFSHKTAVDTIDALYTEAESASEDDSRSVSHLDPGKLALVDMDLTIIAGALLRLKHRCMDYRTNEEG